MVKTELCGTISQSAELLRFQDEWRTVRIRKAESSAFVSMPKLPKTRIDECVNGRKRDSCIVLDFTGCALHLAKHREWIREVEC